jgi:hypothetical protein
MTDTFAASLIVRAIGWALLQSLCAGRAHRRRHGLGADGASARHPHPSLRRRMGGAVRDRGRIDGDRRRTRPGTSNHLPSPRPDVFISASVLAGFASESLGCGALPQASHRSRRQTRANAAPRPATRPSSRTFGRRPGTRRPRHVAGVSRPTRLPAAPYLTSTTRASGAGARPSRSHTGARRRCHRLREPQPMRFPSEAAWAQ